MAAALVEPVERRSGRFVGNPRVAAASSLVVERAKGRTGRILGACVSRLRSFYGNRMVPAPRPFGHRATADAFPGARAAALHFCRVRAVDAPADTQNRFCALE